MTIYVIEEAKIGKYSGIEKYYFHLLDYFKNLNIKPIIFPKAFLEKDSPILRRIKYFIWLNFIFTFKLLLLSLKDEVKVIGVSYYVPFFKLPRVKYYPVVHDLIAVKYSKYIPKWNAFIIKLVTENAIRNAHKIITVSETVKNEIAEYYKYPLEKIHLIYARFSFDNNITLDETEILKKHSLKSKKYILSVFSTSEHKNIKALIEAFNKIYNSNKDYNLVLVGGNNIKCLEGIIYTGKIDNEELKVLYKNAKLYVFPSLVEGFGLPVIDSQNFSIPVLCSDIPVFREVAGDSAEFCTTESDSIYEKISYLLDNDDRCNDLIDKGTKNINRFNEKIVLEQLKGIL